MDRLNVWVIALAALALVSCSGSSPVDRRGESGQSGLDGPGLPGPAVTERELAEPRSGSVMPPEVTALLRPARTPAALPPLPLDGLPSRLPQGLQQSFRDGSDFYDRSDNATVDETTLVLDSADGELAWAIYQLPLLSGNAQITKLYITISNWVDAEEPPHGWIYGLANYDTNSWQTLGFTSNLETMRAMSVTSPYRSTGGNAYVFIATSNLQSITVNEVGFDLEIVGWDEVTLDTGSLPNWTQAIDFTLTDNPVIAYTKPVSGKAWFRVGDRQEDILNESNWLPPQDIDPTNTHDASWIDVLIDDVSGYPRASYITSGHPEATGRTQMVFAAVFPFQDTGTIWLPYALKRNDETFEDGAEWTSMARYGFSPHTFGFVTHVANDTFRADDDAEQPYDMQYRTFQISDPDTPGSDVFVDRTSGFGVDWLYPHISYSDGKINHGFAVNGGNNFGGADIGDLALILEESNSTNFGSIETDPADDTLGSTYVATPLDEDQLMYVDYDAGLFGFPEVVTSTGTQTGGFIGTSQLAYAPDGTPGIVFTESDGTAIYVRYATLIDDAWVVEEVSGDPSTPSDMHELAVIVDLAFDSAGIPAICYNHIAGGDPDTGSLRFAIRQE